MPLNLLPRNTVFFEYLDAICANAKQASHAMVSISQDYSNRQHHIEALRGIENEGDKLTRRMIDLVEQQFITPLDHDDLFRITKRLDSVVDNMERSAAMLNLYRIDDLPAGFAPQASLLDLMTAELQKCVAELRRIRRNKALAATLIEIHRLEKIGDENHAKTTQQLREEVGDGSDPRLVFKWMRLTKLYDSLEKSVDAIQDVANIIYGTMMKHQ